MSKKEKKVSRYLFLIVLCFTIILPLGSGHLLADDEEIAELKKRVIELEMREIENRVIIKDLKDLVNKLSENIDAVKTQLDKQDSIVSTIPRRVPRPQSTITVEDTTAEEIKIENDLTSSSTAQRNSMRKTTSLPATGSAIAPARTENPVIKTSPSDSRMKRLYNLSLNYYNSASYDTSLIKFHEFIDTYPDHDLTDNAQYWIGECYLKKNEYLKAIEEFKKVIEYYPLGNKVPAAYLKIGYAFLFLNDKVNALENFHIVRDMFPHTDAANEAEKKIKELSFR